MVRVLVGQARGLVIAKVGNNPEQDTFFGWHSDPATTTSIGYWYGDFRGRPGDASGWLSIGTSYIGRPPPHWKLLDLGGAQWAVHGPHQGVAVHSSFTGIPA